MPETAIWTVSIFERDSEMDIWTSAFTSEPRALEFKATCEKRLKQYEADKDVVVTVDCSFLNDDMYLGFIDERYGDGYLDDEECF